MNGNCEQIQLETSLDADLCDTAADCGCEGDTPETAVELSVQLARKLRESSTKEIIEVSREKLERVSCDQSYLQALLNGHDEDDEIFNFVPEVSEHGDTKKLFPRYFQRDMKNFYEEFKYLTDAYSIVLEFEVMHWNEYVRIIMLSDKYKDDPAVKNVHFHWVKSCLYRAERRRLKEALVNVLDNLHPGEK